MDYSLSSYERSYKLSCYDGLASLASGVSGIPYAKRHWEISEKCDAKFRLGHRAIAILEMIPVLGLLSAIIERIVVWVTNKLKSKKSPHVMSEVVTGVNKPNHEVSNQNVQPLPSKLGIGVKVSHEIDPTVNKIDFHKFLFSDPKIKNNIRYLLKQTVCKADFTKPVVYHKINPDQESFDTLMNSPTSTQLNKRTSVSHWFDYKDQNHFYIDFAHATHFGGAYRSHGCVQEERMFAEFPELPLLDYKTNNGIHPIEDSYDTNGKPQYPPHAKPAPFIIESITRRFDISHTPYGHAFIKADEEMVHMGIRQVDNPVPVNIIGLAAVDWRNVSQPTYSMNDHIYHCQAAYLAYKGSVDLAHKNGWSEAVIHTAPWGCGAFLNNVKVMIAIQYLASRMAGVNIVFHGVGNPMNPDYTQKNIDEICDWISKMIEEQKTPMQILQIIQEKCLVDTSWAPSQ